MSFLTVLNSSGKFSSKPRTVVLYITRILPLHTSPTPQLDLKGTPAPDLSTMLIALARKSYMSVVMISHSSEVSVIEEDPPDLTAIVDPWNELL
jgi:hypothetical protein